MNSALPCPTRQSRRVCQYTIIYIYNGFNGLDGFFATLTISI